MQPYKNAPTMKNISNLVRNTPNATMPTNVYFKTEKLIMKREKLGLHHLWFADDIILISEIFGKAKILLEVYETKKKQKGL